jgi:transcriptional regulator with XRE-family HTH domain
MARHARQMSQGALGEVLGLTFQQIQKYENGTNRFSAGTLVDIAQALDMPLAFFFASLPGMTDEASDNLVSATLSRFMQDPHVYRIAEAFTRMSPRCRKAAMDLLEEIAALPTPAE